MKICLSALQLLAIEFFITSSNNRYGARMNNPRTDEPLYSIINNRCVQSFPDIYRIASRLCVGKHSMSPEMKPEIEIYFAYHRGTLWQRLISNQMNENVLYNTNETYLITSTDNVRTLGFNRKTEIKYVDTVRGGEGFAVLVHLSSGRDAKV